ncbi:MAG: hypothetical protein WCF84_06355, partial [Anaerolineae bacterium]
EAWRASVPGAIGTVLVGAATLFVPVRAFGLALSPLDSDSVSEDFLDDLASVYRWLQAHAGPLVLLFNILDRITGLALIRRVVGWFNPRRHAWNLVILMGVLIGAALLLAEFLSEGGPNTAGRLVMVAAVFVGLESSAVLLGYALLAQPLGLFRRESADA